MANFIPSKKWKVPERQITPESVYSNRREFLQLMGFTGLGIAEALFASPSLAQVNLFGLKSPSEKKLNTKFDPLSSYKRNVNYRVNRGITKETVALTYNNFYEFTSIKEGVWQLIHRFKSRPWEINISGLVEKPGTYDIDDFMKSYSMEERTYRHRCVETWAMVVPWIGFPMSDLIKKVQPRSDARYIRFTSFLDPEVAPGQKNVRVPWPYTEGITLEEAMNELTFVSTGIYGHVLPPQHGAPLRLVLPWKYGFKSIKSIVKIEFLSENPATFWNTLIPHEYDFEANVDPDVPHPRWSQRREKMIGSGEVFATQKYNGYGDSVARLYET